MKNPKAFTAAAFAFAGVWALTAGHETAGTWLVGVAILITVL